MDLVDFLKTENLAFKRKLQSKSEALHILQNQLQCCHQELEQYRRPRKGSQPSQQIKSASNINLSDHKSNENIGQSVRDANAGQMKAAALFKNAEVERLRLAHLEVASRKLSDENKLLQFDLEDLKQKLNDANNDILMLRKQHSHMRQANPVLEKAPNTSCTQHLDQLEHLNRKYSQLEQDLQILLDEKQDLIKQRDIYYDKMQRLNIQIRNLLNISNQNVDFDAIVMENKYLKQRLEDVLNEKKLWNKTVSKYKNMLNNNCQNTGKILSYDQIAKHINNMTSSMSKQPDQNNLRQICITLLETLNEKNLLLQHQRKTNKVLATRLLELENESGRSKTCDVLLKGYSATGSYNNNYEIDDNNLNGKGRWSVSESIDSESISQEGIEKDDKGERMEDDIRKSSRDNSEDLEVRGEIVAESDGHNNCSKELKENVIHDENGETLSEELELVDNNADKSEALEEQKVEKQSTQTRQDTNHDRMLKDVKEIDRGNLLGEHEDIQNLPVELQKLVLEAMEDLEKDDSKYL